MSNHRNILFIIFIFFITLATLLGAYFAFQATHWSPWAFSDSAAYLSAARNFSAGRGLVIINSNGSTTPVTEFAPFYPVLLSLAERFSGDFIQSARWIDIISFTLTIFLIGFFTYSATENHFAAGFASVFMALSPLMLDAFSGLMSEPFFIFLMVLYAFLLWAYLTKPDRLKFILLLVVTLLLPLTRYAGIIFPVIAGFLLVVFGKKDFLRNFIKGLSFSFLSLLPISLWFLNLYINLDKVGGKHFKLDLSIFHSLSQSLISEFLVVRKWFPYYGIYPSGTVNLFITIFFSSLIIFGIVLGVISSFRENDSENHTHIFFITSLILLIAYLLFIAFSQAITQPQIDIINRTLSPAVPLFLLVAASIFSLKSRGKNSVVWQIPLLLLVISSARYEFLVTTSKVEDYFQNGFGFNSREVQESGFLTELKGLDVNKPMISNEAAFVLFHTNRFPINISLFHDRPYGGDAAYGEKTFRERNSPLIIHLPDFYNTYGVDAARLLSTITEGLITYYSGPIGAIYYYPE